MADVLQFCRPEEVGVHPEWVENYTRSLKKLGKMQHSFLMMRHGKVFAEGYHKPFDKDQFHRMYSVSKTFVSAAIGLLVDDGRIRLTDRVIDYFPDLLPEKVDPLLEQATIRDLLMMATPYPQGTYDRYTENWIKSFFQPPFAADHPAGSEFRYDTSGTYTLDVLVERVAGKPFLEFLKDRMLRDLGFSEDSWCVESPEGIQWGGSGVQCTTRDLARFALVFLNGGKVNGKQYLSEEYVKAATSKQIDNLGPEGVKMTHGHGYGYQIWRTYDNSFSFCGMGGQLAICIPEKDFLFTCTGDMQGEPDDYELIYTCLWNEVIEKLDDQQLPADDAALAHMNETLQNLTCVVPEGAGSSVWAEKINGVSYQLGENPMGIRSFKVLFDGGQGKIVYDTVRGEKVIPFGLGAYEHSLFPDAYDYGRRMHQEELVHYKCMSAAVWPEENRLLIRTYVIDDYFGNMAANFTFQGDTVEVSMTKTAEWFLDEYVGTAEGHQ